MAGFGMPVAKPLAPGPSARRLVGRLRPHRGQVAVVVALGVASVGLAVTGPRLLGRATDIVFTGAVLHRTGVDTAALARVLLLALAVYVVASLLSWLQGRLLTGVVQRTVLRLRADVEAKLHRLPLRHVDASPRGDLLSRVTNDIDNVAQSLQQTLSQLITSLLTVVGVVVMMVLLSPLLAVVALVVVPLTVLVTRAVARRSQPLFVAQWASTGALGAQVEEAYTGHELVRAFGRQEEVGAAFAAENERLLRASRGAQAVSGTIMPLTMFLGNLGYVAVAVVGGLRVTSGALTLGDVQAFVQYSRQFTQPLTQLASMANLLQSGLASAERVFELLDAEEEPPDPPPALPARAAVRGRVVFEHVSFRYSPDRPLIEDLSLVAEPGQTVAVVGPTGAGKTTLVNLVMRFYDVDAGRITVDGVDVRAVPRAQLRSGIGMVLQDTWLFGGTIAENIAYGRPGATEAEVRAAAEAAYVDRFVRSLPDGYATVLDAEGGGVSTGERQLITIARAFLADPVLLILDEATSSVDTRTEVLVQHAMAALRSDRTSFVIAHRLSTITGADLILVMEAGRIVEQGRHADLLAAGGAYARLHAAQVEAGGSGDEGAGGGGQVATVPAARGPGGGGDGAR